MINEMMKVNWLCGLNEHYKWIDEVIEMVVAKYKIDRKECGENAKAAIVHIMKNNHIIFEHIWNIPRIDRDIIFANVMRLFIRLCRLSSEEDEIYVRADRIYRVWRESMIGEAIDRNEPLPKCIEEYKNFPHGDEK